jgi:EpsI family protein
MTGAWQPVEDGMAGWRPAFKGAATELVRTYSAGQGRDVGLYIGYYRDQGSQRELVSSANMLVKSNDRHWVPVASGSRTVPVAGRSIALRTTELGPPASSLGG